MTGRLALLLALALTFIPAPAHAAGNCFRETGYCVGDEGGVRFWSEFQRLGGVAAVGYPASDRFEWDGFTVQVFQRVIFQWRPEVGRVYFVNVFDRLHALGRDDWLLAARQTPRQSIPANPLAVLDAWPAIRARYYGVGGDPIEANGLPTSPVQDMGNHYALRAQRAVFQQWKQDVPWARAGEVTIALGGDIAKEAGILPLPPTRPTNRRTIVGYYAPWDARSWESFQANAAALDIVAAQWVTVDACGGIGSRDDRTLSRLARERGVAVYPSLVTFSGWLNSRILTDPGASARAIAGIVDYVVAEEYPGFDLDLEGIDPADRAAYSAFVERLAEALHARGKRLSLAVPPKPRDATTGWAGAYDYRAIGRYADLVMLMTYEYHGAWGEPGPVAPHGPVGEAIAFATRQMPPEKVLLGLGLYGYDWNLSRGTATAIGYPEARGLMARHGVAGALDPTARSMTFRYRAAAGDEPPAPSALRPPSGHDIKVRTPVACPVAPPPAGPTPTPPSRPPPPPVQDHVVWLEDAASVAARLEHADRYGVGGIGFWRLGQEDPATWPIFQRWRGG